MGKLKPILLIATVIGMWFSLRSGLSGQKYIRGKATMNNDFILRPSATRYNNAPVNMMANPSQNTWGIPQRGEKYRYILRSAEIDNSLPENLLARMAWQESRFREDIISGRTKSSAGAIGIMQIVPKWHPGVDPLDPEASIYYAGQYVRRLFDRFGSWDKALAAYNWGQGNVSRKGMGAMPLETRNYVAQILNDVNVA